MRIRLIFLFFVIFLVTGCASLDVEPAEDGWDKTENRGPGVFTGNKGELSFKVGQTTDTENTSTDTATPLPGSSPNNGETESGERFQEFKAWQAWKKAKASQSNEYLEFREWLEFNKQKSRQGGNM